MWLPDVISMDLLLIASFDYLLLYCPPLDTHTLSETHTTCCHRWHVSLFSCTEGHDRVGPASGNRVWRDPAGLLSSCCLYGLRGSKVAGDSTGEHSVPTQSYKEPLVAQTERQILHPSTLHSQFLKRQHGSKLTLWTSPVRRNLSSFWGVKANSA